MADLRALTTRLIEDVWNGNRGDSAYDATFRRSWEYQLAFGEAGFAAGELDVEQLILA